jgi:hypothetical protein
LAGSTIQDLLSGLTSAVEVNGRRAHLFSTALLNVLLTRNGHYYLGFVTPDLLEATASSGT